MLSAITTAFESNPTVITSYNADGGYISEINGLTAGDAGGWDGWTGTINGIAPMVGFGSVYLQDEDEICVQYVVDWSSLTYGTADDASSGFSFSAGVFSYLEGDYSTALTLTLPADALSVQVTAVPNPDEQSLRIYHNGALTGGLDSDIGIADGDALQIVLGDYEKVYNVAVRLVNADTAEGLLENTASDYAQDVGDCWYILGVQAYGSAQAVFCQHCGGKSDGRHVLLQRLDTGAEYPGPARPGIRSFPALGHLRQHGERL
jgi:hypothetical protein